MEDNQDQTQEPDLTKLSKEELRATALVLMKDQIKVFKTETKKIVDAKEGEIEDLSHEMINEFQRIQRVIDAIAKEYKSREV